MVVVVAVEAGIKTAVRVGMLLVVVVPGPKPGKTVVVVELMGMLEELDMEPGSAVTLEEAVEVPGVLEVMEV
tara:strand:+ start:165 stop:380 length:216 start_codon:yes stop_codon:yes gene_type:complete